MNTSAHTEPELSKEKKGRWRMSGLLGKDKHKDQIIEEETTTFPPHHNTQNTHNTHNTHNLHNTDRPDLKTTESANRDSAYGSSSNHTNSSLGLPTISKEQFIEQDAPTRIQMDKGTGRRVVCVTTTTKTEVFDADTGMPAEVPAGQDVVVRKSETDITPAAPQDLGATRVNDHASAPAIPAKASKRNSFDGSSRPRMSEMDRTTSPAVREDYEPLNTTTTPSRHQGNTNFSRPHSSLANQNEDLNRGGYMAPHQQPQHPGYNTANPTNFNNHTSNLTGHQNSTTPGYNNGSGLNNPLSHNNGSTYNNTPGHNNGSSLTNPLSHNNGSSLNNPLSHNNGSTYSNTPVHNNGSSLINPLSHNNGSNYNNAPGHHTGSAYSNATPGYNNAQGYNNNTGYDDTPGYNDHQPGLARAGNSGEPIDRVTSPYGGSVKRRPVPGADGQPIERMSTMASLKAAAAGIHGAGETLRGAINSKVEQRTGGSAEAIAAHDAVTQRGLGEINSGKLSHYDRQQRLAAHELHNNSMAGSSGVGHHNTSLGGSTVGGNIVGGTHNSGVGHSSGVPITGGNNVPAGSAYETEGYAPSPLITQAQQGYQDNVPYLPDPLGEAPANVASSLAYRESHNSSTHPFPQPPTGAHPAYQHQSAYGGQQSYGGQSHGGRFMEADDSPVSPIDEHGYSGDGSNVSAATPAPLYGEQPKKSRVRNLLRKKSVRS